MIDGVDLRRFRTVCLTGLALLVLTAQTQAAANLELAGMYQNERMSIELVAAANGVYTGTIHLGANDFPLQGRVDGIQLRGTFKSQGSEYPFTASRQDEIIRGYRTVEDTQTGYHKDVDLGYSKEIVDKLNEKEGYNRYKEIPLRDQY
jgi:hypothetical protein